MHFGISESCVQWKMTRKLFKRNQKSRVLLEIIHLDVCGNQEKLEALEVQTNKGLKYFITFIDDCSRFWILYFVTNEFEALKKFKEFQKSVETQSGRPINSLSTNRGGKYKFKD